MLRYTRETHFWSHMVCLTSQQKFPASVSVRHFSSRCNFKWLFWYFPLFLCVLSCIFYRCFIFWFGGSCTRVVLGWRRESKVMFSGAKTANFIWVCHFFGLMDGYTVARSQTGSIDKGLSPDFKVAGCVMSSGFAILCQTVLLLNEFRFVIVILFSGYRLKFCLRELFNFKATFWWHSLCECIKINF